MTLYMVELTVADLDRTVAWLAETLGWQPMLVDRAGRFALYELAGQRLAVNEGAKTSTNVNVVINVPNLDIALAVLAEEAPVIDVPHERYRRASFRTPDGWKLTFFEWTN